MPKIIENVPEKILVAAVDLFQQHGYANTDMRQIAAHTGIAVGTLYRYYESKEALYFHILRDTWKNTRNRLKEISEQDTPPKETLNQMALTLMNDLHTNRPSANLWREIARLHTSPPDEGQPNPHSENLHAQIATLFGKVITRLFREQNRGSDPALIRRLSNFAFIMVVDSSTSPPDTFASQANLITDMFCCFATQTQQT